MVGLMVVEAQVPSHRQLVGAKTSGRKWSHVGVTEPKISLTSSPKSGLVRLSAFKLLCRLARAHISMAVCTGVDALKKNLLTSVFVVLKSVFVGLLPAAVPSTLSLSRKLLSCSLSDLTILLE